MVVELRPLLSFQNWRSYLASCLMHPSFLAWAPDGEGTFRTIVSKVMSPEWLTGIQEGWAVMVNNKGQGLLWGRHQDGAFDIELMIRDCVSGRDKAAAGRIGLGIAAERGYTLTATVCEGNRRSRIFIRSMGFTRVGECVKLYNGKPITNYVVKRCLDY